MSTLQQTQFKKKETPLHLLLFRKKLSNILQLKTSREVIKLHDLHFAIIYQMCKPEKQNKSIPIMAKKEAKLNEKGNCTSSKSLLLTVSWATIKCIFWQQSSRKLIMQLNHLWIKHTREFNHNFQSENKTR